MERAKIRASIALPIHQRIWLNTLAAVGNVNGILTHKEGGDGGVFSLPDSGTWECVKKDLEPEALVAVWAPFHQLSKQDSQGLPDDVNPLTATQSPGSQAISAKSAFVLSW